MASNDTAEQVSRLEERAAGVGERWLLLIHQLPAAPAYFRVKIWRRVQALGAVAVKNAVYALPFTSEAQEDFEWLLREIVEGGGEALICEARLIDGLSDQQIRDLFNRVRDADYDDLAKEARTLAERLEAAEDKPTEIKAQLARLKKHRDQIVAIDFFGANGRDALDGLLGTVEAGILRQESPEERVASPTTSRIYDMKGRVWVTREGVHVDRIASAWLIRRFIDPDATFKFVPAKGYVPSADELRFDMYEAEFTHEGDQCTFEVLLGRAELASDEALRSIADIVHDIDLKDAKFGRDETGGIKTLIAGICMATDDDDERLARGGAVFEDLYGFFRNKSR